MPLKPSLKLAGWPIRERGLCMELWGNLFVTLLSSDATDREINIYFEQLAKSIDSRVGGKYGLIMTVGDSKRDDQKFLQRQGRILKERNKILGETTLGFVMVTGSWIARVATRVIFTLAPPPFPYTIADTAAAGFAYMQKQGILFEPGDIEAFQKSGRQIGLTVP